MIRIAEIRKEKGISQKELAQVLNISPGNLCEWEKGRIEPNIHFLIKLADYFECSIDYLVGREDDFGNITTGYSRSNCDEQEKRLLKNFRQLNSFQQKALCIQAKVLVEENIQ